jgi:uncharacterized membrane protein (DUF2068 family)
MTGLHTHLATGSHKRHRAGLVLIAAYKLLAALLFVAVGVGALHLVHKDVDDFVWHALVEVLHWSPESRVVQFLLEKAELVNDPMLKRIGFGAFCYAAVGIIEAVGLYLEKTWAEFLTVLITASFLPIEVHELIRRFTWMRIGILAINVAVFLYLIYLLGERGAARARARHIAHDPGL